MMHYNFTLDMAICDFMINNEKTGPIKQFEGCKHLTHSEEQDTL